MKTNNLKEAFQSTSSFLMFALTFILPSLFLIMPLVVLDTPIWLTVALYLLTFAVPTISGLALWVVWVWSFIIQIQQPTDTFAIIYYIVFALWVIIEAIPSIFRFVRSFRE